MMKKFNIKTAIALFTVIYMLFLTGCSGKEAASVRNLDPEIEKKLASCTWEYPEIKTTYQSEREFEYWKFLSNENIKLFYDANYYLNYSDAIQKHIHCFYGEELENYDSFDMIKGIEFSRLDHPELELLNTEGREGSCSNVYYTASFNIDNITYDEYLAKIKLINQEIEPLVAKVNAEENLYEKYKLIYTWIIENYTYFKSKEAIGIVDFTDTDEFILAHTETHSTQNIESILTKEAICDGFADTFKYVCNACKLECMTIIGYVQARELKQYHAWNIVPYNGKWYLIDATFGNSIKSYDFFMCEDLFISERTPVNIGIDLPMYKNSEGEVLTFENVNEITNTVCSEEGVSFTMENEYFEMESNSSGSVSVFLSSEGMNRLLSEKDFTHNKIISSNCKISKVKYYSNTALIKEESIPDNTVIFYEYLGERHVDYIKVYVDVEGSMYEVKFAMCGA